MKRSILVGVCGWMATLLATAAVPSPDQLLPAEVLAMVTVPDMVRARSLGERMPASKLWADPAMKPFREKFMGQWNSEIMTPLEREFGVNFAQLAGLAQGQVTLALTRTGLDEEEPNPGLLVLVDSKDREAALTELLTVWKKKWADSGKQMKPVTLRGVEFTSLTFNARELTKSVEKALPFLGGKEAGETDKEAKTYEWLFGQSGSLLVVGDHAADVEKVLARLQGGSAPGLAQQEKFAGDYPMLLREATAYLWVDLSAIVQRVLKQAEGAKEEADEKAPGGGMTPQKLFEPLGLMGLQTLSVAFREQDGGGFVDALVKVPASQRKGIFNILRFEPLDADPPSFVPADVSTFFRLRWDLKETWQRVEKLVTDISPQAAAVLGMVIENAGKDKDPGFNLRQNLIANLGNDLISYEKAPRETSLEALTQAPSIYLLGSSHPDQLSSAFKALAGLMPVQGGLKEREFLGRTVYSLSFPQEGGEPRHIHFSPSGGYVAISMDEAMLEEFLRTSGNPGESLRDSGALKQAAEKVGGMSTGFFGYENQRESMRAVVESLRKDGSLENLFSKAPLGAGVNSEDIKKWVDFTLLPPFEQIAKYFHIEVYSGNVTAEGYRFKVFSPPPPGQ